MIYTLATIKLRGISAEIFSNLLVFILLALAAYFALGPVMGQATNLLQGLLWFCLLSALLHPPEWLWRQEIQRGTLEQIALSPRSLEALGLEKILLHVALVALPQLGISLPLWLGFGGAFGQWLLVIPFWFAGTVAVAALVNLVMILTEGARAQFALRAVLLLPLASPIIIFGSNVLRHEASNTPAIMLLALAIGYVTIAPLAIAAGLRHLLAER